MTHPSRALLTESAPNNAVERTAPSGSFFPLRVSVPGGRRSPPALGFH